MFNYDVIRQVVDDSNLDRVKYHPRDNNDDPVHHLIAKNNPKRSADVRMSTRIFEDTYLTLITLNVKGFAHGDDSDRFSGILKKIVNRREKKRQRRRIYVFGTDWIGTFITSWCIHPGEN